MITNFYPLLIWMLCYLLVISLCECLDKTPERNREKALSAAGTWYIAGVGLWLLVAVAVSAIERWL